MVLRAAEAGKTKICTSAVTLVEVIKIKGHNRIERSAQVTIERFFMQPFIDIRNADQFVAETARELMWDHPHLNNRDAIHLATAVLMKVPLIESHDEDFLKLDGKIGSPPIQIAKPYFPMPGELFDEEKEH